MSKQQTKTHNQAQGTKILTISIFYITALVLASAVFSHILLPPVHEDVAKAKEILLITENKIHLIDQKIINLSIEYSNGRLNDNEVSASLKLLTNQLQELIELESVQQRNYNEIKLKHRVFGFASWNKFLWSISVAMVAFVMSLVVMLDTYRIKNKLLRNSRFFFASIGGLSGGYMIAWAIIEIPGINDLPKWCYYSVWAVSGFLAFGLATYSLRWWQNHRFKQTKFYKSIIKFWMSYLINDIPKKLPETSKTAYFEELNRKMEESL
jgi:hypothetical protein